MKPKMAVKRLLQDSRVRNTVRMCLYSPVDVYEAVMRKSSPLIAPRGMRFNDLATYLSLGKSGRESLIQHCQLQPDHKVLDAGCGCGTMALALFDFLTTGSYEGFDIVPSWVTWCQNHFTRRNPRFRFTFLDVYSKHYNSSGKLTADTLKFPYEDENFDCIMLMSVFTHMLPAGIRNYIRELSRVMKNGAHGFITTFLLNDESMTAVKDGRSAIPFRDRLEDCLVMDQQFPETAIAVPEDQVKAWLSENRLQVKKIMYGSWAGRDGRPNLQDIFIVQKA